ncbi:MAG TPA: rhomboid family intramembrane serine protease [Terriglobia bacterium]|nr:rhomboid family intramembrane serine protease [Terriglobia bacterium]
MQLSPRLRFKLERFKTSVRQMFGEKEPEYDTSLRMCPNCRGLIPRNASECHLCGMKVRAPRARPKGEGPERVMGIIPIPSTASAALVAANLALYGISWYLTEQAAAAQFQSTSVFSGIDPRVLVHLGAKYGPLMAHGEWWRLVTAVFLHGGLLHIGLNLWCLIDLGPEVESLFSIQKFIVFYLVTGVFGFIVSFVWSPFGLSIGASGAIVGLIGVLIGGSYHLGHLGKAYRSQLWRWVIYIVAMALVPGLGIDNAAHIGGLAAGLLLGYLIPTGEPETRNGEILWNTLAVLSVLVIAGSFALMALQLNRPL